MKRMIMAATIAGGLVFGSAVAMAQSTGSYLIPYGMSAGMQVLDRALQPRPAAAPTLEVNAGGYGAPIGERRLVCEQWNGHQGSHSRGGWAVQSMSKEPRQCIKCHRWFYDSIFYPEGYYGTRWHDCDRINHVARTEGWCTQPKSLAGRIKEWLAG